MALETKTYGRRRVRVKAREDNFGDWRVEIAKVLEAGNSVEFNALTPTGKQAALSLLRRRRARFVETDGSLVVEGREPNRFLQVLTAGLIS